MAAGDRDRAGGQSSGTIELVGSEDDRRTGGDGLFDEAVDEIPTGRVEPGVGLVEEPELWAAGDEDSEGDPAPLSGAEAADGEAGQAPVEAEAGEGGSDGVRISPSGADREADVLGGGEVVVEEAGMADEPDPAADGPAVVAEVLAEDAGLAAGDGEQAGERPQEGGLARPVGAAYEHHLASVDVEVDTGEGGEAVEEDDRGAEADDGPHGSGSMLGVPPGKVPSGPRRPPLPLGRRVVAAIGRTFITSGVLILLFVAYQLWGTNFAEARSQSSLKDEFAAQLQRPAAVPSADPSPAEPAPDAVPPPPPEGAAVAIIKIPKIGVEKAVVEGVSVKDLKKGPGHYPTTPMPGQPGNAAIAGHRTTYGAPFFRLDELAVGDPILVTTLQGTFRYEVRETIVIRPSQNEVLNASPDNRLTLTTCEPRYSAAKRLVVVADLVDNPAPAPPPEPDPEPTVQEPGEEPEAPPVDDPESVSGDPAARLPALAWGALAAVVWLLAWLAGRRWRRWPAYVLGTPVFLVVLFVFFENVARLLPANY